MPDSNIHYVSGDSDALYYRELFRFPDTDLRPEDQPLPTDEESEFQMKCENALKKLHLKMSRLEAVKEGIKQPWFRLLEEVVFSRIRKIEISSIWKAIEKGDSAAIYAIAAERRGILAFFDTFANITRSIDELNEQILRIQAQESAGDADGEPDVHLQDKTDDSKGG